MTADPLDGLRRPLRFAAGRDFQNLSKVKGLEASLSRALEAAGEAASAPLRAELEPLVAGLDGAAEAERRRRVEAMLELLGRSDATGSTPAPSPSRRAPPRRASPPPSLEAGGRTARRAPAAAPPSPEPDAGPGGGRIAKAAPKAPVRRTGKRRPMAEATPSTPLVEVVGVGPKTADRLAKKGLETVQDALFWLPRGYEDRTSFRPIAELSAGDRVSVKGEVLTARVRPAGRGKRVFEMAIADGSGTLSLRFFRFYQSQMESRYPRGTEVVASGLITQWGAMRQMVHPELEIVSDESAAPGGLIPMYSDVEGVPTKKLRTILAGLAAAAAADVQDPLPAQMRERLSLPEIGPALLQAHLPSPDEALKPNQEPPSVRMRARLVFDELLFLQLALTRTRARREARPGLSHVGDEGWRELAARLLPFEPTGAQSRALDRIAADLAAPQPMNRLLQGDVGSGKTAVAFVAMALVWAAGRQSALLAPTEILAEQHFRKAQAAMDPLGIRVALLTGSTKASERRWLLSQLRAGALDLLIGTHAILEDAVVFKDLGLAIVDEQHRFGVEQRAKLKKKREAEMPDVLVMTATPIPRTLALTAYGDLRTTVIDELPPGRSPTETRVFGPRTRSRAIEALGAELAAGRQAYVVFPLIDLSEKLELKAATDEVEGLRAALKGHEVALLHGRMRPEDKAAVMARFVDGEIGVLVSTTVIEVGVDVANATVMMVENAERFGLSQLHQLRGRVGRGAHRGRCFLVAGAANADAMARLAVLEASHDGFVVAQRDLEIRGPGEMLGTRQSGLPDLVLADVVRDAETLELARDEAERLMSEDPALERPEHAPLAAELERRFKARLELAEVG